RNQSLNAELEQILQRLLFRIRSVKQARNNKYILLNAPNDKLDEIIGLLPGMKSPTVLVVSYVGFADQEVAIGSQTTVNVSLQPGTTGALDEVVVVGYGTQRKKDVTGAIGSVKGEAIKNLPVTNVAEALQGRVAGVEVIKSTGEPG
ncbi:ATP phosphoribosyltransferase, C-terminal-like domain protein, partial [Porphyromonas gingivalis JCVI SC001]